MTVIHIVEFKFNSSVDKEVVRATCSRMMDLKDKCVDATGKRRYIKSLSGGKDNSPEGLQNGYTHAFVVEFEREEDRDYYVKHDEAHQIFIASIDGLVDGVQVVDYTPDAY